MKKLLLSLACLLAGTSLYAQKLEVTAGAYTGLMRFSGKSAESSSTMLVSTNSAVNYSYTNNPYGSKLGFGYGINGQAQLVGKAGFIVGLQLAYEQLKSKIDVTQVFLYNPVSSSTNGQTLAAEGSTGLKSNIINVNPYLGYRILMSKVRLDILAGADMGYISSTREKGAAHASDGKTYNDSMDRTGIKEDYRLRVGIAAGLNKFTFNASYANGISNYMADYLGGDKPNAHTKVIRVGLGYRIF
jgi:hypothetical protein